MHLFRDAVRAKEIVTVLLRYRFDEILRQIDTPAAWLARITPAVKGNYTIWQRVRFAIEELGPTFVKAAQLLSTRPDILPRELIEELKELRDNVKPLPFEKMRPVLEKALGEPFEKNFEALNEEPVASGSMGQVYRARHRASGREVAIKIQRPGIHKPITIDLEIIGWFAEQLHQNISSLRPFDLPTVVEELRKGVQDELDFRIEAGNASLFNALNQSPGQVFAPAVFEEYTDERLLVSEWVVGTPPDELHTTHIAGHRLARAGGDSFFAQITVTGFFHADPHPGNLLVTDNGRLCFLDWGLAGQLTRAMRFFLVDLFSACQEGNAERVSRIAIQMGASTRRIDRVMLEKAVTALLFRHADNLKEMRRLGHLIFDLIWVFGANGIHVARDYTLLARAIISIEESALKLDPEFNLAEVGKPFVRQISWERWNPITNARHVMATARERLATLAELPTDLQRLLHRIEDEDIQVQLEHQNLERATDGINHAFSRLALAIIIGSLFIGSSLVITTGVQPYLWGYPAIGLLGYLLSGMIGLKFVWDLFRAGNYKKRTPKGQKK
ncbi:MAG: ABC1 kinase family protein, partial [Verrucomicrobiota bacterium]